MGGATRDSRRRGAPLLAAAALALALFQTSCVVLPVRYASGVAGVVVDAETHSTVADAVVVVRFDGRFGDVLPDREVLGHREARTDSHGRFRVPPLVRPGLTSWPGYRTDARIVAVLKEGYRCAQPLPVRRGGDVRIPLQPALDAEDQRSSCRPVPANPGEAEDYMSAWRSLYPTVQQARDAESERQIVRLLEARSVLGFGENCEGPVTDLALSPDGQQVSFLLARKRPEVHLVELTEDGAREPTYVARDYGPRPRRLAWTSAGDLVLWQPSGDAERSVSPSIFGSDRFELLRRSRTRRVSPPAAPSPGADRVKTGSRPLHAPLDPADLNDEADARWLGRSFTLERSLDPRSGLASERLVVTQENGDQSAIDLPGEPCGPHGRFGRPHYRISASGRAGIDLRFVDGGCHALLIEFETGAWQRLDDDRSAAACSETRNVPASHFNAALRSYAREVELARTAAGGDSAAAYALIIAPDGRTRVETRSLAGGGVSAEVPRFPLATPLRRINVSLMGDVYHAPPTPRPVPPPSDLEPL